MHQQRVPAAGDQAEERRLEATEEVRRDVPLQMIDRRERQLAGRGQGLSGGEPDQQRSHEPRTLGRGDQLDLLERHARLAQRLLDDEVDQLEVLARGDLRDDSAEAIVHSLRGDHVRAQAPVGAEHRRAGVVAAALQREDRSYRPPSGLGTSSSEPRSVAGVRHITIASSPLSW